ncbi:MAG: DUF4258 domain-containing protein [Flavobacteriaceae bacterium]|jgi:hypothetical protein|nr:DUF4258 domain-containing protein [Flavobacteriaceae bacterium]
MAFVKRLFWYLIGLGIGSIFLWFIVDKKTDGKGVDFCYLPNCRVVKDLRTANVIKGQDSLKIAKLLEEASIDFKRSEPRKEPCKEYLFESAGIEHRIAHCPEGVRLIE